MADTNKTINSKSQNNSSLFVEIHRKKSITAPDKVEVVISTVEPKYCNAILKELSHILPLHINHNQNDTSEWEDDAISNKNKKEISEISPMNFIPNIDLSHLRRIRNPLKMQKQKEIRKQVQQKKLGDCQTTENENNSSISDSPNRKKIKVENDAKKNKNNLKNTFRLDVIIGTPYKTYLKCSKESLNRIQNQYKLTPFETINVPGRSANSKEELIEWNQIWPTLYFHRKTDEHLLESLALTIDDLKNMSMGMKEAIQDAKKIRNQISICKDEATLLTKNSSSWKTRRTESENISLENVESPASYAGVAIVCPLTNCVVSRASEELVEQYESITKKNQPWKWNPLSTSIILAIQGVSRKERMVAVGKGMESDDFKKGQVR